MAADPTTGVLVATPITVTPPSSNGTLSAADLTALQNANVTRFRYDFTGAFATARYMPGTVTVTVPQNGWKDSNGDGARPDLAPTRCSARPPTSCSRPTAPASTSTR